LFRQDQAVTGGDAEAQVSSRAESPLRRQQGRAFNGDNPTEGGPSQQGPPTIGKSNRHTRAAEAHWVSGRQAGNGQSSPGGISILWRGAAVRRDHFNVR
jgi:hypothetical protein